MSTSKNKILLITVIILLVTNIAMLAFFLTKDPGKKGQRNGREAAMVEFLKNDIGFSSQQMQAYDTLSKQHREKVKTLFDEMRNNKEQQLKELGTAGFSDSSITLSVNRSAENQKMIERGMLLHFAEIRKLCTAEQQPKFDSLFYKVMSRKGDNRKKPDSSK
jgi:protein CpxP